MKTVSAATTATWLSGDYVGDERRPMARATVQTLGMRLVSYDLAKITASELRGIGRFASAQFGQAYRPYELPNVKSIRWNRSLDQDVATATIVLYNTAPVPLGQSPPDGYSFDLPGYYTYNRGATGNRWGDVANGWRNRIVPDRIVRTYEGYGFDPESPPELDPHMHPSGVWLIDEVVFSVLGHEITLECRDVGRLLLDHIAFPPVVPFNQYPLTFTKFHNVTVPKTVKVASTGWRRPKYVTDSNIPYVGSGITDAGYTYVSSNGEVYGHHGRDALDGSTSTYWLSVGNKPNWSSAYEYVEGSVTGTVAAVRAHVWGGPYKMWISVKTAAGWQGRAKIPYRSQVVDTNADIPYVKAVTIAKGDDLTVKLPKSYAGATRVRVTFSRLFNSGLGHRYRYRAGLRDLEVSTTVAGTSTTDVVVKRGNFADWTDIVKWLCAWGGFYWPTGASTLAYQWRSDGAKVTIAPSPATDPVFPAGRVWGDFEQTGTATAGDPPQPLGVEVWDKKPLQDCINYVKEIVGYNFYVDENGAIIWRSPNIFRVGNWIFGQGGNAGYTTTDIVEIDERTTLLDLTPRLSSRTVREKIFVADVAGRKAATSGGYNPFPSGMRRVGGWTDQLFTTQAECQVMADMITLRQALQYQTNTLVIAANPAVQIDDQVRVYERITGQSHLHYVKAISSEWSIETGKWTYTLETNWLGDTPFVSGRWFVDSTVLAADTKAFLAAMGNPVTVP